MRAEEFAAILMPRSPDMVAAVLAVLLAGAAYVPVDPGYPAARVEFMLADADPVVVLCTAATAAQVPAGGRARVVILDHPGDRRGGRLPGRYRPGTRRAAPAGLRPT